MTMRIPLRMGMASLTRNAYSGKDLTQVERVLAAESRKTDGNPGAMMDLSVIEQLKGNLAAGLDLQLAALGRSRFYRTQRQTPGKKTLLVLAAPIHMGGNTPVEFLLEQSDYDIVTYYVIPGMPPEERLPDHDIAFVAAPGDSDLTRQFIDEIDRLATNWPTPVLNKPTAIKQLERDSLQRLTGNIDGVRCPAIARLTRADLVALHEGRRQLPDLVQGLEYPFVIRPVGSHAGRGLDKIRQASDLSRYLPTLKDEAFFVTEYVDYSSPADAAFRKYRIVFVDGKPFPCHMAIAEQWKVWYMNAGMQEDANKRTEEALFMDSFDEAFAIRHSAAFAKLHEVIGLDYFGIDCAEDREGNLLLFEADNALIVHDMDGETLFPYKKPHMQRLFDAFADMLDDRRLPTMMGIAERKNLKLSAM